MAAGAGSLLTETKKQLRRLGLHAKKGLGQHFLADGRVLRSILAAAELAPSDNVVEVGPGLGILTRELAKGGGRVIAVEVDPTLASALKDILAPLANITIVNADVLEIDPQALMEKAGAGPGASYKVVANLPYYIASAVVRRFLETPLKPQLMVVMVQKEVAQAIVARPGEMSLLSVGVQLYGKPAIVRYVQARSFYPPPKVDSAILRIEPYHHPAVEVKDAARFFEVVRGGFSAPRKQLHNSLAQGLKIPLAEATAALQRAGIEPKRRAQTLSLEEWAWLYRALEEQC